MSEKLKIGILVSGSGSNLQSIINHIERGLVDAQIQLVICNNLGTVALERAEKHGLPYQVINHRNFSQREDFEAELVRALNLHQVELVVLAGFMRVLSPYFLQSFPQRIINIHPALLPSFPGTDAQKRAWEYGVKFTGCTVHFVDEGVDTGPIIIQSVVPVHDQDTINTLSERILGEEHRILPMAIQLIASSLLEIKDGRVLVHTRDYPKLSPLQNPSLTGF